jgi:LysR family transcriptional regulator (chromosome initiation inhibitor)
LGKVGQQPPQAQREEPHMLDRDQLETFATVVEQQSFDRAATVLSITRGAVSQRIKALE